jgi:hypothetical protein
VRRVLPRSASAPHPRWPGWVHEVTIAFFAGDHAVALSEVFCVIVDSATRVNTESIVIDLIQFPLSFARVFCIREGQ